MPYQYSLAFFSLVHLFHIQTMQSFLSFTCIYLVTGILIKGRRSNDYRNDWEGFDFYLWRGRHLLLAAFKPDRDCWVSHDRHFFFLLTFSFAIWLLIVFILYWKGRYIFSEATWYKFWYSQFFLSSTHTGAALSLVPQPTHPAPATEMQHV